MRICFIGDVMGRPGRKAVADLLPRLKSELGPFDFVIANTENAAGGFGLTEKVMHELFQSGIDIMTSGNHIWDKREFLSTLSEEPRMLRPANYPPSCPGRGCATYWSQSGKALFVINLQGRAFMVPIDCPFRTVDRILESNSIKSIFVDIHAEATSEKRAMGLYLDGRVSAVAGTHTHVQTSDEEILPNGTAYISDVGMTGGHGGVIGMKFESVLPKFLEGIPSKFELSETNVRLNAVVVDIDEESGRSLSIRRICDGY